MTNPIADPGHGHSPAAWTAVVVMLLGFVIGTVAFCFEQPVFVYVGFGVIVVGLILGWILSRAGYGVRGPKFSSKAH